MTTVACVLRSGGDYRPEHVAALYHGVRRHWPGPLDFMCLTDTPIDCDGVREIPLEHEWRGWWAKMELLRLDIPGTLLYLDLDCVVVGDLTPLAALTDLTVLRDFYRPKGLQTALMVLPEHERRAVWEAFTRNPASIMARYRSDQEYLETHWLERATRMQDVVDGLYSYKADRIANRGVPRDARVIMYHGKPRPWETELWAA